MAWTVEQFGTVVTEFIATLTIQDRTKLAALLTMLEERGNLLQLPQSKALGGDVFELRTRSGVRQEA